MIPVEIFLMCIQTFTIRFACTAHLHPGHFHLNGQSFDGELSETQDMSGLVPCMVFLFSLKCGNVKDTREKSHQSATPIPAHHRHTFNTALLQQQCYTITACVYNTRHVWANKVLSPPWELAKLIMSRGSAVWFDYVIKNHKAITDSQWKIL